MSDSSKLFNPVDTLSTCLKLKLEILYAHSNINSLDKNKIKIKILISWQNYFCLKNTFSLKIKHVLRSLRSIQLWSIDTDTDTGHDTDTWTPVKHIKFNSDTSVGVVSVSCRVGHRTQQGAEVSVLHRYTLHELL